MIRVYHLEIHVMVARCGLIQHGVARYPRVFTGCDSLLSKGGINKARDFIDRWRENGRKYRYLEDVEGKALRKEK